MMMATVVLVLMKECEMGAIHRVDRHKSPTPTLPLRYCPAPPYGDAKYAKLPDEKCVQGFMWQERGFNARVNVSNTGGRSRKAYLHVSTELKCPYMMESACMEDGHVCFHSTCGPGVRRIQRATSAMP